jgi:hypothetical protein
MIQSCYVDTTSSSCARARARSRARVCVRVCVCVCQQLCVDQCEEWCQVCDGTEGLGMILRHVASAWVLVLVTLS